MVGLPGLTRGLILDMTVQRGESPSLLKYVPLTVCHGALHVGRRHVRSCEISRLVEDMISVSSYAFAAE